MKITGAISLVVLCIFAISMVIVPQALNAAQTWQAILGAATSDQAKQAMSFLPNELWIHAGDSVSWTSDTHEGHTVTFLTPVQPRPPFPAGCPGTTPSGSPYTGANCVNSGPIVGTYTVTFPNAGNFKLVCLIHQDMTGMVHVLNLSETLPHNQAFYDGQRAMITDDILRSLTKLIPLAESQREVVGKLRLWLKEGRAISASFADKKQALSQAVHMERLDIMGDEEEEPAAGKAK